MAQYLPDRNDIVWLDFEPAENGVMDQVLVRTIALIGADSVIEKFVD